MQLNNKISQDILVNNDLALNVKNKLESDDKNSITNLYNDKIENKDNSNKILDNKTNIIKENNSIDVKQNNTYTKEIKKDVLLIDVNNLDKRSDLSSKISTAFNDISNIDNILSKESLSNENIEDINNKYKININSLNAKEVLTELKTKIKDDVLNEIKSQYDVGKAGYNSINEFKSSILPIIGNISSVYNNISSYDKQYISNILK